MSLRAAKIRLTDGRTLLVRTRALAAWSTGCPKASKGATRMSLASKRAPPTSRAQRTSGRSSIA